MSLRFVMIKKSVDTQSRLVYRDRMKQDNELMPALRSHFAAMGRLGGRAKSPDKIKACRRNLKLAWKARRKGNSKA